MTSFESGWLIEEPARDGYGPKWLQSFIVEEYIKPPGFWLSPTSHAADALRFARKSDAEVFLHNLQHLHRGVWDHCIVTDHSWSMTLERAAPPAPSAGVMPIEAVTEEMRQAWADLCDREDDVEGEDVAVITESEFYTAMRAAAPPAPVQLDHQKPPKGRCDKCGERLRNCSCPPAPVQDDDAEDMVEKAILLRLRDDDDNKPYTSGFNNGVRAANVVARQTLERIARLSAPPAASEAVMGELVEALESAIYLIEDAEKDTNWCSGDPYSDDGPVKDFRALLAKVRGQ